MTELLMLYLWACHNTNHPLCVPAKIIQEEVIDPGKGQYYFQNKDGTYVNHGGMRPKWH